MRDGLEVEPDTRQLIGAYLGQRVEAGEVRNRDDVVAALEESGLRHGAPRGHVFIPRRAGHRAESIRPAGQKDLPHHRHAGHVDNEAQLAMVLGHEIGHIIEEHALESLRRRRSGQRRNKIVGAAAEAALGGLLGGKKGGGAAIGTLRRDCGQFGDPLQVQQGAGEGEGPRAPAE